MDGWRSRALGWLTRGPRVVAHRVDALTVAFRAALDRAVVDELVYLAKLAREHGRVAFRWRKEGALAIVAELRFARAERLWRLTNEGLWRIQIDPRAAGGGELRDCGLCKGLGSILNDERCPTCDGAGSVEAPGWTVEIIWSAKALADKGLSWCLRESTMLARTFGTVLEQRLRRIDVCADVAGWAFDAHDSERLAKRPQALWSHRDEEGEPIGPKRRLSASERRESASVLYGRGVLDKRRITGLDVGRGGALMCRMYDKRIEIERPCHRVEDRDDERWRWFRGGWDGTEPVTRVEFQIRGVALTEMGIRDPDAPLKPRFDVDGKAIGHELVEVVGEDGQRRQATLVDRLQTIWEYCTRWVKLVVPTTSRNGNSTPASRCPDDPRWALLRALRFHDVASGPLRRYRPRAAASSAQALGITLSCAGKEQRLAERDVSSIRIAVDRDPNRAFAELGDELRALKVAEADRIRDWLVERFEGIAGAWKHFAIRSNAALARFSGEGGHAAFGTDSAHGDRPGHQRRACGAPHERASPRPRSEAIAWSPL